MKSYLSFCAILVFFGMMVLGVHGNRPGARFGEKPKDMSFQKTSKVKYYLEEKGSRNIQQLNKSVRKEFVAGTYYIVG